MDIQINGEEIDLKMKLGESGVAFFVEEADGSQVPSYMLTSPLPEPGATPTQTTDQVSCEHFFGRLHADIPKFLRF